MPSEDLTSRGSSDSSSRGQLEEILGDYLDRMNAGEILDRREIIKEHPEVADDIIERLEIFHAMGIGTDREQPLGTLGSLGDYTLRRQIGRGGMGVVYDAWENSMDRQVALKVLPAGLAADDRTVTRFVREARLAGRLNHSNVVSVYGMGLKEQTPYYAMLTGQSPRSLPALRR